MLTRTTPPPADPRRGLVGSSLERLRSLRAGVLTPSRREVDPAVRGFYTWEDGESIVPRVGGAFLDGFEAAAVSASPAKAIRRLAALDDYRRGFAVEGAAMAFCVRAATEPWQRSALDRLLTAAGERHTYMIHVGVGWAMARLPRPLWPDIGRLDPTVAGLVLDGYGFHECFFHPDRTLDRAAATPKFPIRRWPGSPDVAHEHLWQGIGRALWFVAGGNPATVADLISTRLPAAGASSAWSGVGLAAAYACGRPDDVLRELVDASGDQVRWLRQGAAFGVEARVRADTVLAETRVAAAVLVGLDPTTIRELTMSARPPATEAEAGDFDSYERWRRLTAAALEEVRPAAGSGPAAEPR